MSASLLVFAQVLNLIRQPLYFCRQLRLVTGAGCYSGLRSRLLIVGAVVLWKQRIVGQVRGAEPESSKQAEVVEAWKGEAIIEEGKPVEVMKMVKVPVVK